MNLLQSLFEGNYPRLVAFDLDGTLVDSVPDLAWAIDRMLEQLGRSPAGVDKVRHWVGNGTEKLVARAILQQSANSSAAATVVQADELADAVGIFRDYYRQHLYCDSTLYDGVAKSLENLRDSGCVLTVITNKPKEFAQPLLSGLNIDTYFQRIWGGNCVPYKKPHPQPLLECALHFNLQPRQCLMVGDSVNDVQAARAAGYPIAAVSYGYNQGIAIAETDPDVVIDDLQELFAVCKQSKGE